jgi:hypothetical protein
LLLGVEKNFLYLLSLRPGCIFLGPVNNSVAQLALWPSKNTTSPPSHCAQGEARPRHCGLRRPPPSIPRRHLRSRPPSLASATLAAGGTGALRAARQQVGRWAASPAPKSSRLGGSLTPWSLPQSAERPSPKGQGTGNRATRPAEGERRTAPRRSGGAAHSSGQGSIIPKSPAPLASLLHWLPTPQPVDPELSPPVWRGGARRLAARRDGRR